MLLDKKEQNTSLQQMVTKIHSLIWMCRNVVLIIKCSTI